MPFARAFVLTDDNECLSALPDNISVHFKRWRALSAGRMTLFTDSRTNVATSQRHGTDLVILIGKALDVESPTLGAEALAEVIREKHSEAGLHAALKYIAYLVGRFVVFLITGDRVYAIPDCACTYALLFHCSSRGVAFASNWNALKLVRRLDHSEYVAEAINSASYKAPQGKSIPAHWTPVDNVFPVFANCYAEWSFSNKSIKHHRFYPFEELPSRAIDDAYGQFRARLLRSIAAIASGQDILLPITAGLDSKTTLLSLLHSKTYRELTTYTYLRGAVDSLFDDAVEGNRLSAQYGLVHRLVPLKAIDTQSAFYRQYRVTFQYGAPFSTRAQGIYDYTPEGKTIMVSTVTGIGKMVYKERSASLSPETLARLFTTSEFQKDSRLISAFGDYIEYTQFSYEFLSGYDFYDLFYWEHRLTKWGALSFSEFDLNGFCLSPFNDRFLMEIMLSVDVAHRCNAELQKRFIADNRSWKAGL
jgi:hypothetical protein